MTITVASDEQMKEFGARLGAILRGGEVIELVGDVGAGKTTFVKGLARGLSIDEDVQSPTFTINRTYSGRDDIQLVHYDFYRLNDAGIMADEIREVVTDPKTVVVVEWSDVVARVLPDDRLRMTIRAISETAREISIEAGGVKSARILEEMA
ncbi:tRNA (adenosine(37)-N6)-threonylcarbamoyltransferase complex ATPase subunit type 1 TsaE [Candidatus Saccharibacteria bacterium 32-49-10]|nr:MAG: tRNA (adenosine(37)-N6)-threonylcarbamoyltransferase complex ATPase subunit type 1 TsaE [Candidatus Saccharibacteria bacterium 32-49-10]